MVQLQREPELLDVVGTLDAPSRFARGLNGRQDHRHEYADDGNDDEELDERKGTSSFAMAWGHAKLQ